MLILSFDKIVADHKVNIVNQQFEQMMSSSHESQVSQTSLHSPTPV